MEKWACFSIFEVNLENRLILEQGVTKLNSSEARNYVKKVSERRDKYIK